jgi:hypothetical protein
VWLAEVTPAGSNDEKQAAACERQARHDRPPSRELELGDLCGRDPDTGEYEKQKPDFGEASSRLLCETENEAHVDHSSPPPCGSVLAALTPHPALEATE